MNPLLNRNRRQCGPFNKNTRSEDDREEKQRIDSEK